MVDLKPSVDQDVVRTAFLKKAKRMKKKFFVLRCESATHPARLEYYDSDKKWRNGNLPKKRVPELDSGEVSGGLRASSQRHPRYSQSTTAVRTSKKIDIEAIMQLKKCLDELETQQNPLTVVLKNCFNINRKYCAKNRYVLALHTRNDSLVFFTETEADLNSWLKDLLLHQRGEDAADGDEPKPSFDHVWEVIVAKKSLGSTKNINGPYRLCLTAKSLKLVKVTSDDNPESYEFLLSHIRRCGNADSYFFMVVGRSAVTGQGEFWMQSEDTLIAQNMHEAVLGAMNASSRERDVVVRVRPRTHSSSAAPETPKPGTSIPRRQTNPVSMMQASRERSEVTMGARKRTNSESKTVSQQTTMTSSGRYSSMQLSCESMRSEAQSMTASPPIGSMSPAQMLSSDYVGLRSIDDREATSTTDGFVKNRTSTSDANVIVESPNEDAYLEHTSTDSDKINRNIPTDYFEMTSQAQTFSSSPSNRLLRGHNGGVSSLGRTISQSSSASTGSRGMLPHEGRRARSSNAGSMSSDRTTSECSSITQEYFDMSSPSASWIPGDIVGTFSSMGDSMISKSSGSHTRSSSLCEGEDTVDGYSSGDYLTMTPQIDGTRTSSYVEMKIKPRTNGLPRSIHENGIMSSPMGSCSLASSVTSGTASAHASTPPSSFKEMYNLDKVTSYVSANPGEDDGGMRKTRAYSVGSKLEMKFRRKRFEALEVPQEQPRLRSFSMGNSISGNVTKPVKPSSQPAPSQPVVLNKPGKKCASAPMLGTSPSSSSWSGNTGIFFKNLFGSMTSSAPSSDLDVPEQTGNNSSSIDSLSSSYQEERMRRESFSSHDGGSRASSTSGVVLSRPRSDSRTSSILGRASGKLASLKKDRKREKLESVPQGRDQDYIEVDCQSPLTDDYVPMGSQVTLGSVELPRGGGKEWRSVSECESEPRSRKVSQSTVPDIQIDSSVGSDYLVMELGKTSDYMPMVVNDISASGQKVPPDYVNVTQRSDYLEMQPRIQVTEPDDSSGVIRRNKNHGNDYLLMSSSGTATPSNASCRNSRTEDEFEDYMEMTFKEVGSLKVKPERGRSLISDKKEEPRPQRKTSKTQNPLVSLSNMLTRKSSKKELNVKPVPSSTSVSPRPTKSAPASQYSSLKRPSTAAKEPQDPSDYMSMNLSQPSPSLPRSPASPESDYVELATSPPISRPNSSLPISITPAKSLVQPSSSPLSTSPRKPAQVEVQKVKGSDYTGFVSLALNPEVKLESVSSPETPGGTSAELFMFESCSDERRQNRKDYVNMDFSKSRRLGEPAQFMSIISPLAMSPIPEKSQSSSVETLTSPCDFVEGRQRSRISSVTDLLEKAATSMQLSPKRHCSGDQPVRKTAIPIYRSNSYNLVNKCRSASGLSDIPDKKTLSAVPGNGKPAKSPPFSIVSGFFGAKTNCQPHTSRSSSSSITSLGEEEEIKSMIWKGQSSSSLSSQFKESCSTSPSSQSRPSSTSSDKELNYATLDLPPPKEGQRSRPCSTGPEACTSTLSYARIDFTRQEGLRQTACSLKPREKELT